MLKQEGIFLSKQGGPGLLAKGLPAMVSKKVPYTVTKQVSFDMLVTAAYTSLCNSGRIPTEQTKVFVPLGADFVASLPIAVFSQPGDMLLIKVNAHYTEGGASSSEDEGGEVSTDGSKSTIHFIRDIMKEDGISGFFVGMRARFLHVGIIVTMQLLIYDFVKRLCGIPATGLC